MLVSGFLHGRKSNPFKCRINVSEKLSLFKLQGETFDQNPSL